MLLETHANAQRYKKTQSGSSSSAFSQGWIPPTAPVLFLFIFCTLQTQNSPGRWAQEPCPAREQPKSPALEGSRHRIRLLRVLSHSHGKPGVCAGKHGTRTKASRAIGAPDAFPLNAVVSACRTHGWLFLRFSHFHSPFSAFSPSYQNEPAFSSGNTAFFACNGWISG